jgi:hypothetical protein
MDGPIKLGCETILKELKHVLLDLGRSCIPYLSLALVAHGAYCTLISPAEHKASIHTIRCSEFLL